MEKSGDEWAVMSADSSKRKPCDKIEGEKHGVSQRTSLSRTSALGPHRGVVTVLPRVVCDSELRGLQAGRKLQSQWGWCSVQHWGGAGAVADWHTLSLIDLVTGPSSSPAFGVPDAKVDIAYVLDKCGNRLRMTTVVRATEASIDSESSQILFRGMQVRMRIQQWPEA